MQCFKISEYLILLPCTSVHFKLWHVQILLLRHHVLYNWMQSALVILWKILPEDGSAFAETYVGVEKYILYLLVFLCVCLCWRYMRNVRRVLCSSSLCNTVTKACSSCASLLLAKHNTLSATITYISDWTASLHTAWEQWTSLNERWLICAVPTEWEKPACQHRGPIFIRREVETCALINCKRFLRRCIILCGDGFMDFIHRPKIKILQILNNWNHNVSEAGSASIFRRMEGEKRRTPTLLGPLDRASLHHWTYFNFLIFLIFYSSDEG
jgi:hypothetical protein